MELNTVRKAFAQANDEEAQDLMNELMRRSVRLGLLEALEAEVNSLCGKKHHPEKESPYYRAGSEKGSIYANGKKEEIVRPRVREKDGKEVQLSLYEAASSQENLFDTVVEGMAAGLSSRATSRLTKGAVSKSSASRMWIEKSKEQLEAFRARAIDQHDLIGLQIDGVHLREEVMIVIALGIDRQGYKHALDFEQGSSESAETVGGLLARLHQRGLREPVGRRLLVQRDGSPAIAKAVHKYLPNALQQECVIHLQRNVKDKMKRKDRADLDLHFKHFREAQGKEAGEEAWEQLCAFVNDRNALAANALRVREDVLLTVHRLDLPATLNRTFLSTNIIENAINNWRLHTGNVKLWNEKKDMVTRWAATGLLWSENTFNRVAFADDLHHLEAALSFSVPASVANAPSASSPKDKENLEPTTT